MHMGAFFHKHKSIFQNQKSLVAAAAVLAALIVLTLSFLLYLHAHADHSRSSAPVSGTDVSDGSPSALTAADIANLGASDGVRMQSDGNWPRFTSTYNEARYIEFVFSPNIPADASVQTVSITNVYRRTNTLTGAKLEIWDGTDWSHVQTLPVPSNTTTDATSTFDVSSYLNTPVKLNNLRVRFLAYNSGNQNTRTQHDLIQVHATFTILPTIVSVTIAPTNPTTNSLLTATTTAVDTDGDPLTIQYQWKKNGADVGTNSPTLDLSQPGYGDKNDSITVLATVDDGHGGVASKLSDPVVVANAPPVVTPKTMTTSENAPVDIALAGTDEDNDPLTYSVTEPPLHGQVVINGATATYTPNPYYDGSDIFTFEATDGTDHSAHVSASITVTPVNYPPVANSQSAATEEHIPVTITLPAYDPDNDPITYSIDTLPTNGTLGDIFDTNKVTYTPTAHFFGTDTFTFHVSDGTLPSDSAPVTVSVVEVNDAPVASDGAASAAEDTPILISLAGSDPKGTPVTFATTTSPAHGTLGPISGNSLTYTPDLNYYGPDEFLFTANDGIVDSNLAKETITVSPVNDAPTIAEVHGETVDEGAAVTVTPVGSDPESPPQVLTYSLADGPAGMSVDAATGVVSWTPTESQGPGVYPIVLDVSDGTLYGSTTFTLTVREVNTPPVAQDGAMTVEYGSAKDFTPSISDADIPENTLALFIVAQPLHGNLVLTSNRAVRYTPLAGFSGADSFLYAADDGSATSSIATVGITVGPQPESPVPPPVGGGGPISGPYSYGYVNDSGTRATATASTSLESGELGTTSSAASTTTAIAKPSPAPQPAKTTQAAAPSVKKVGTSITSPPRTIAPTAPAYGGTSAATTSASTTPQPAVSAATRIRQAVTGFIQGLFGRIKNFFFGPSI